MLSLWMMTGTSSPRLRRMNQGSLCSIRGMLTSLSSQGSPFSAITNRTWGEKPGREGSAPHTELVSSPPYPITPPDPSLKIKHGDTPASHVCSARRQAAFAMGQLQNPGSHKRICFSGKEGITHPVFSESQTTLSGPGGLCDGQRSWGAESQSLSSGWREAGAPQLGEKE